MQTEDPTVDRRSRVAQAVRGHPSQASFADDHLARFADLHVAPGTAPGLQSQYAIPPQDHMYGAQRGMPAPMPQPPAMSHGGRPMGASSRQVWSQPLTQYCIALLS